MTRKGIACHSHVVIRDTLVLLFENTTWFLSTKNVQLPLVVQFIVQDQCHVPSEVQFGGESTRGEVTHEQLRFPQGWAGEKGRGALLSWSTQVWFMPLFVVLSSSFLFIRPPVTLFEFVNIIQNVVRTADQWACRGGLELRGNCGRLTQHVGDSDMGRQEWSLGVRVLSGEAHAGQFCVDFTAVRCGFYAAVGEGRSCKVDKRWDFNRALKCIL